MILSGIDKMMASRAGRNLPTKYLAASTLSTFVFFCSGSPVGVAVVTDIIVFVVAFIVEVTVRADGVEVMVFGVPEIVVTYVVGSLVVSMVVREPSIVDTTVNESRSPAVGVVTSSNVVRDPPTLDVMTLGGGVVMIVLGDPSGLVVMIVCGASWVVKTFSSPPTSDTTVRVIGSNPPSESNCSEPCWPDPDAPT